MDYFISVIIPIYNVSQYLEKGLNSLLDQNYEKCELILIDDGSTDSSGEICDKFAINYSNIVVIHQENQGVGISRNNGISIAKGKYIYFFDPDDYLEGTLFLDVEQYLYADLDLIMFGYWDVISEFKKNKKCFSEKKLYSKEEFEKDFKNLFQSKMLYTLWNKLYRKNFLLEHNIDFSNIRTGEDVLFNFKVYEFLNNCLVLKEVYYNYLYNRLDSATTNLDISRYVNKLNEFHGLTSLFEKFNIQDLNYLKNLKQEIFLDYIFHIYQSEDSKENKKKYIMRFLKSNDFTDVYIYDNKNKFFSERKWILVMTQNYNVNLLYYYFKFRKYLKIIKLNARSVFL